MHRTLLLLILAAAFPTHAAGPRIGDSKVFITLPPFPGFPEQPITDGDQLLVCTDAHFGTVGQGPAEIQVFSRATGALEQRIQLQGQDLSQEHGQSAGALDLFGRLYTLDEERGIIRTNLKTGQQEIYSPALPFLPICGTVPAGTACAPKLAATPPLANDIVFGIDGSAYVSDSFQATIFRIPNGGGAPQIWFQDPRLASPSFGPNGMRFGPDGLLYVNMTADVNGDGFVYTLPPVAHPQAGDLKIFHHWTNGTGNPDDLAFGLSGKLYVSQPFQNQISILDWNGNELGRFPDAEQAAALTVQFDTPSGIDFDDATGSIYIANHAEFDGNPANMVVFKSFVADFGWPLIHPLIF